LALSDGAGVRVGGLHQGNVKHIQLPNRPEGKMTVTMDLDKATRDVLKKDSVASIKSEGLIGDKYVEISFGSDNADPLKDGDTIPSEAPLDVSNLGKEGGSASGHRPRRSGRSQRNREQLEIDQRQNQRRKRHGRRRLINDKTIYQKATAGATALTRICKP